MTASTENSPSDFIRDIIAEDIRRGKHKQIRTRFPPEPNGYLHIGHAKSICLNFGIAREFGGICNVRMDDTNPTKEEAEYVQSIMTDVRWLVDSWADNHIGGAPFHASDYFERFYEYAVQLIRKGKAYVCDMTPEETDAYRRLGKASCFRDRSVEENLDLFARMKAGEFLDGARTLRAKIDVNAANVWLRDPVRSEEHTSELQSQSNLVCRLLLEKKKKKLDDERSTKAVRPRASTCKTALNLCSKTLISLTAARRQDYAADACTKHPS